MPKPAIFKDEELQRKFDEDGFVSFSMFSAEQVQRIHAFYLRTQAAHETIAESKKFHATNETNNADLIGESDQFIKSVFMEEVDKHFTDYQVIAANYLVKQPHLESELGPHQDLRFVDEEQFYSLNIWMATTNTTKENGSLRFIRGSHLWADTIRTLPSYPWKYREVTTYLNNLFTDVETKIGDCVVINHACIHSSYPNLSSTVRVAAIMAMIPKTAEIKHYFLPEGNPENEVEEYNMTLSDFIELKVGHRPQHAQLIRTFKYDFSPIEHNCFQQLSQPLNNSVSTITTYAHIKQKISAFLRFA